MGSCFADRIGQKLSDAKWPALLNPFGVIYNPISLFSLLERSIKGSRPEVEFAEHLGLFHSFELHSQFNHPEREKVENQLAFAFQQTHQFLSQAQALILTLGTAWIYRRRDTGAIVANNHKYPADFFQKELLSLQQITEVFFDLKRLLEEKYPALQILLTVSPVRHLRDTLSLNAVSKATLRLACHQFSGEFANVHYFPAYELMMDDLRDYRFYAADMLHPNPQAEQYIWEYFQKSCMPDSTRDLLSRWEKVQKSLAHRPMHPQSPAYKTFLENLLLQLRALPAELNCQKEIKEVQIKLAKLK
jgi:hypothetical protein